MSARQPEREHKRQPVPAQPLDIPDFRADCPCPKPKCELRGRCIECRRKHGRKGQLPRCER